MVSFPDAIRALVPEANPSIGGNCELAWEPNKGFYIAFWDEAILGPQPTAEQIASAMNE